MAHSAAVCVAPLYAPVAAIVTSAWNKA